MNRPIKFRAFDKQIGDIEQWNPILMTDWLLDSDVILMQFTGLLDKNGKEIYEGDIVKADNLICKIEWKKYYWAASWKDKRGMIGSPSIDFRNLEIIGNIWENPELLENNLLTI